MMFTCNKCGEQDKGYQVNYCWRCQPEHYKWDKLGGKPPVGKRGKKPTYKE